MPCSRPQLDRTGRSSRARLAGFLGLLAGAVHLVALLLCAEARAQAPDVSAPTLSPAPNLTELSGLRVVSVTVVTLGTRWQESVTLKHVRVGQEFHPELTRRALRELTDTGRFASAAATIERSGGGVALRLEVVPRRLVDNVRIFGGAFTDEETQKGANLETGMEVTDFELARIARDVKKFYAARGFPAASVKVDAVNTDEPMQVVLLVNVERGAPEQVQQLKFEVTPARTAALASLLTEYEIRVGDRRDDPAFRAADTRFQLLLRQRGWHQASITHELRSVGGAAHLSVAVNAGPHTLIRFEGNRAFDEYTLRTFLDLEESEDLSPARLAARVRKYYQDRGFYDCEVNPVERLNETGTDLDVVLQIKEERRVRVVAREYPCLTGERTPDEVGDEIDSFLSESLPGADIFGVADPATVNTSLAGTRRSRNVAPLQLNPWATYSPAVYERAVEHLQELYRSEGYLGATVGPVVPVRRQCDPRSPSHCVPLGAQQRPATSCPAAGAVPVVESAVSHEGTCHPDPSRNKFCEPDVLLHIPIKLGPKAFLWDVAFEGNKALVESDLAEALELKLGTPVSQAEIEKGRQRLFDRYGEEGFAFVTIDVDLELSPDQTRARVRFIISEREQVRVRDIRITGAHLTRESLILGRVALTVGDLYRRSEVRKTEERLATLGVFSNIVVSLENPNVPAREKTVLISLTERPPQYLDVSPGFSTGEGLRIAFEYGHRNIAQRAIQLTLRIQLAYLPDPFILDEQVRINYSTLPLIRRLERRNTAGIQFPEIGLGPLFRFGVDAVDARDNSRDFGVTKHAGILTLQYRPTTRLSALIGPSFEINDAEIFNSAESVEDYIRRTGASPEVLQQLQVPQGQTFVIAQRIGGTWDRRDSPFGATEGTFVSGTVEHVNAFAAEDNPTAVDAHFLRYRGRVAGYLRLSKRGLALAASLRVGYNQQLNDESRTYPDRLFFMGGEDSLRGFLLASVVPEDLAERILDPSDPLTVDDIAVRGGDFLINPRLELRIPLTGGLQTAVFLDTGNLWLDPGSANPFDLRYTAGTGLRYGTPIGPLALDYGIVLDRRPWEDFGNFHFSVGLF